LWLIGFVQRRVREGQQCVTQQALGIVSKLL
jgi:hypothetical protein